MHTRREFLAQVGYVSLLLVPIAACGSSSGSGSNCDGVSSTSTVVSGHSHTVCVPASDLANPPAGGATYTTSGPDPTHTIALTAEQLTSIQQGHSVAVTTSTNGGHSHDFALAKASARLPHGGGRSLMGSISS
jgi:hypothetical protein